MADMCLCASWLNLRDSLCRLARRAGVKIEYRLHLSLFAWLDST